MKILKTNSNFIREPLIAPFGFKGGYLNELWQIVSKIETENAYGIGLGVQSVLWSDSYVFSKVSQSCGNSYMYAMTDYALKNIENTEFKSPFEIMKELISEVYSYGKKITNNNNLRKTFALNSLVSVDNALWQLYSREKNEKDFIKLVPDNLRDAISGKESKLCNIPLVTYNMEISQVLSLISRGFFLLKIKIGSDPDKDGSFEKMLEWDKNRLKEIHNAVKDIKTEYTESGHIPYYLDANGRYDTKGRLMDFLEFADKIGALERIIILEEPFAEDNRIDVSELPVRIAADESAHSLEDAVERIGLGYKAIALKPIAKTLTESLLIASEAYKKKIPCFIADLTVNPFMVDINKNVAARLPKFPGMKVGMLESNGPQNYVNWEKMKTYHPMYGKASHIDANNGIFTLDDNFYKTCGGIFENLPYYEEIV